MDASGVASKNLSERPFAAAVREQKVATNSVFGGLCRGRAVQGGEASLRQLPGHRLPVLCHPQGVHWCTYGQGPPSVLRQSGHEDQCQAWWQERGASQGGEVRCLHDQSRAAVYPKPAVARPTITGGQTGVGRKSRPTFTAAANVWQICTTIS